MTYVDDLYEPGDDREPAEPEPQPVYTLDQIEAAFAAYQRGKDPFEDFDPAERAAANQADSFLLDEALPQLLTEARQMLARWESLPTCEEWAVSDDSDTAPSDGVRYTAAAALSIAARDGRQAWRQTRISAPVVISPWEPIDSVPPF